MTYYYDKYRQIFKEENGKYICISRLNVPYHTDLTPINEVYSSIIDEAIQLGLSPIKLIDGMEGVSRLTVWLSHTRYVTFTESSIEVRTMGEVTPENYIMNFSNIDLQVSYATYTSLKEFL